MNKIGFNVLAWSANVSEELFPILDRLKKIGYDGAEFFVGDAPDINFKKVGNHCQSLGLEVTTVTVVSPETNPVSESVAVREKALDQLKRSIDRSHYLGSSILCGPCHSAHAHFVGHEPREDEYKWSAEVLNKAGDHAKNVGLYIGLEALNRFESYLCNTMEQLSHLIKLADHSHVQAMYDTHHANMEEKSFTKAINAIAPFLKHVHISENDRGTPGTGHIDFDENFKALKNINYQGWYTIEAFSRNDVDFANAINVWREYNDPWHIAENGYKFIKENLAV